MTNPYIGSSFDEFLEEEGILEEVSAIVQQRLSQLPSATEILAQLQALKPHLAQTYGVQRIGLFGSVARNQAQANSDIDIVVEMQPDLLKRVRLKQALEQHFGRQVDVIRYWQGMNPYLKSQIDREARYA